MNELPNEINYGNAAFLVRGKEVGEMNSTFWKWLSGKGYKPWKYSKGFYENVDWAWINVNSKRYAHGMPGIQVAGFVGSHAITVDEFKVIIKILDKYEGKPPLQME